jgi:hypothetical protein
MMNKGEVRMSTLWKTVAVTLVVSATTLLAQPKLEVIGGTTYDWGTVKPPKEGHLEATIKMKNVGNQKLIFTEIKPGCGCTKTDPDKMEVDPNDVSTMSVKLNISPSQSGPITKSITIRSNSQPDSVSFLFLKANIQRPLQFSPNPFIAFTDLKVGQESSAKVELINNEDKAVELYDFKSDSGLVLNQTGRVTLKPHEKIELIVRTVPQRKGNYSAALSFKTSHPDHETMDVKVYGNVLESNSPVFQKPK